MSRPHHTSRLAVVALALAGSALAACAEWQPTAPAPRAVPASHLAADSGSGGAAPAGAPLPLPEGCTYAPDSARLDSTGVDPDALAAALACGDSVSRQYPFEYPLGEALQLPDGVSLVGAITALAADSAAPGATAADAEEEDAAARRCADADTVGAVSPAAVVVCLTLRNDGADSARVTLPGGLVLAADARALRSGVVVTPIDVALPGAAERTVAVALYATSEAHAAPTAGAAYHLGPVSAHPVVRELVDAAADPARGMTEPRVIQHYVLLLAEHGNDEITDFLRAIFQAGPPPDVKAAARRGAGAARP